MIRLTNKRLLQYAVFRIYQNFHRMYIREEGLSDKEVQENGFTRGTDASLYASVS